jgi:hypothetical protein
LENAFYRKAVHPGGFSVSCCHFSCVIFIGIQMASAYVGSTFIPPLFGLLGNLITFSILPITINLVGSPASGWASFHLMPKLQ